MVRITLRTKAKLGFIDGSCEKPSTESHRYNQWVRCDSMVVNWLLNSMVPDLSEAFLYVNSAQELWNDLTERFGESNGPLLYQLEKEISYLYQGNDSVDVYYTKLKKLWDELLDLSEIPVCNCAESCTAIKKTAELEQRRKLMQFLMHLNEDYDIVRGQILLLDPLPTVNKAYSMIQRVEKQKQVTSSMGITKELAANVFQQGNRNFGETEQSDDHVAAYFLRIAKEERKTGSQLKDSALIVTELITLSISASNYMVSLIGIKIPKIKMAR